MNLEGRNMMKGSNFCPCKNYECEFNPHNHEDGCDRCMEDSIKTREIPRCLFEQVIGEEDINSIEDWSFENFASYIN
jgi:hypothetical protein